MKPISDSVANKFFLKMKCDGSTNQTA